MKRKIEYIVFICCVFYSLTLNAQLDTLRFIDLESNDVILSTTKEHLYKVLGKPEKIRKNQYSLCYKTRDDKKYIDTTFYFNEYSYYKKFGVMYAEREGKVQLQSIDFYILDTVSIIHPKIVLSRQLKISEFEKVFPISSAEPPFKISTDFLVYKKIKKDEVGYLYGLFSGFNCEIYIDLYFDESGKLRYIDFGTDL